MSFATFIAATGSSISTVATAAPLGAVQKAAGASPKLPGAAAPALTPQQMQQIQAQLAAQVHHSVIATNMPWLTHTMAGIFVICAVGLIVLLALQTTKQEGLSGTIGGRVESAYRPRLGFDQQMQRLTSYVALTMVFFGVALSITGI